MIPSKGSGLTFTAFDRCYMQRLEIERTLLDYTLIVAETIGGTFRWQWCYRILIFLAVESPNLDERAGRNPDFSYDLCQNIWKVTEILIERIAPLHRMHLHRNLSQQNLIALKKKASTTVFIEISPPQFFFSITKT